VGKTNKRTERPKPTERRNLTKHAIAALSTSDKRRATYYDTKTRGLGVLVQPTGHRAFFWFRKVRGRGTWKTIGEFPAFTVEQARARASELNASVARWKATDYAGDDPFERRRDPTLGAVLDDYLDRHLQPHAKNPERAIKGTRWAFDRYLAGWRDRKLGTIRRADVRALHAATGEKNGQVTANRLVTLLRTLYNWALKNEIWHGENPARGIAPFPEASRTRFLQPDELARLFTALREEPNRDLRDFVLLALFTGARRGDVLAMRWEQIVFETSTWQVPEPKSRKPYVVPLIPEAVEILTERRARAGDNPWVFPGRGLTGHVTDFKRSWRQLLKRAEIPNLRVHDLRRTLGSWQAAAGTSLPIIGATLGHRSLAATQVYARLNLDPVRQAVMAATRAMLAATEKKPRRLPPPER
jgi:integrase